MISSNMIIMLSALILFTLLIYSLVVSCDTVKEGWVNYQSYPYGNIDIGAGDNDTTPVAFYKYPVYRRPYNYPVCHLVNYPIPHCRTNSL